MVREVAAASGCPAVQAQVRDRAVLPTAGAAPRLLPTAGTIRDPTDGTAEEGTTSGAAALLLPDIEVAAAAADGAAGTTAVVPEGLHLEADRP